MEIAVFDSKRWKLLV